MRNYKRKWRVDYYYVDSMLMKCWPVLSVLTK